MQLKDHSPRLKLTREHYDALARLIADIINHNGGWPALRHRYVMREFPRADKVKDINKRLRWDLIGAASKADRAILPAIYDYADDGHIDTAVKRMLSDLPEVQ